MEIITCSVQLEKHIFLLNVYFQENIDFCIVSRAKYQHNIGSNSVVSDWQNRMLWSRVSVCLIPFTGRISSCKFTYSNSFFEAVWQMQQTVAVSCVNILLSRRWDVWNAEVNRENMTTELPLNQWRYVFGSYELIQMWSVIWVLYLLYPIIFLFHSKSFLWFVIMQNQLLASG